MTLVFALCLTIILCAFSVLPEVRLVNQGTETLDVTYQGAEVKEGILKLTASFEDKKEGLQLMGRSSAENNAIEEYEISKDIVVATDVNFQYLLQHLQTHCQDSLN